MDYLRLTMWSLNVFLFCGLLLIQLTIGGKLNMLTYDETVRPTKFEQIAQDRYGNVYVGGTNVLYKLSDGLRLKERDRDKVYTGPVKDGLDCEPGSGSRCKDASLMDNDAVILENFPGQDYLLFCGSVNQGLCTVYSMADLNNDHILDSTNVVNLIGNRKSAYAFFGKQQHQFSDGHTLYIGMSHDGRPTQYAPKAVSARDLKQDQTGSEYMYNISYAYEANGSVSGIDINAQAKEDFIVKYIYGFEHDGFSYFVTVQREDLMSEKYTTKLVRVCQGDPKFYSYTEVELSCRKAEQHSTFYNIAQAAYLSPVGKELTEKFGFTEDEQVLFVGFGKADYGHDTANSSYGYGMCMFTMSDIQTKMIDTQLSCYTGWGSLLPWINMQAPKCKFGSDGAKILGQRRERFCGSPLNVGIGGRYPMQAKANITNDHVLLTSLGIVNYKGKTIAVIGTQGGHVMKVLVDGTNSPAYATINVGEGATHPAVAKDIAFDSTEQHMYALTGNRVTKVPIQSCKVYSECSDCVTARDPISCGWCGDYCSTRSECRTDHWKQRSCPPVIHSFDPRSGPVQGGTRVTIQGHNFGATSPDVSVNVVVSLVDCVIDTRNSTSIVCQTGESKDLREIDREVKVVVVDLTKSTVPFDIEGPTKSDHESFSYKKPAMTSFSPRIGPKSGGTEITIKGRQLDVGSRLNITVGYLPCKLKKVNSSTIICSTSKWEPELDYLGKVRRRRAVNPDTLLEGTVNVTIDSANLHVNDMFFTYKEDPVIESVEPKASILSGGLHIEVGGTNLNVVHDPKIVATVIGEEHIQYKAPCESSEDGLTMNCSSPTVDQTKFEVTEEEPLQVNIHFLMDGVQTVYNLSETNSELSKFTYMIDPVFHKFDGYGYTHTFYEDDTHLIIHGKYIDLVDITDDLRVTVGDTKCNVTKIGYNIVICAPERPTVFTDKEPSMNVVVHIGYLEFSVGHLQFAKRDPNILLAQILGPVMGFAAAVFVIFIVCYMKHNRRCPWKKQVNNEPHVRYIPGDILQIGTDSDGGRVYRMPQNQNPYWSQNDLPTHNQAVRQRNVAARDDSALMDDESRRLIEDANLLISRESLILCDIIGQGHFGCVYRGFMRKEQEKEEIEVAVKTLKSLSDSQYISSNDGRKFLEEALRMRDFDHPHILTLIGIALDKDCDMPLVVLPFMRHGDLLSFIRDDINSPTVKDLMDFAIQVSRGMAYLANLKFVHRDLAARNCMLDDRMNVKVADFGLSRDIYERDYYSSDDRKAKLPVKWMALESLEKGIYNNKTDVWSYGVVLWELMTRGICPYPEVDNWDIIKYLKSGRRMPQPQYCPDHLYMIMLQCWDGDPMLRPSFAELVASVESIIANMLSAHEHVGLNASYVNVPTTQGYLYPTPTPTASAPPEGAAYFGHYDNNNLSSVPTLERDHRRYPPSDSGGSLTRTLPYVNEASKSTLV